MFGLGAGEATKGKVFIDRGGWPLAICLAWFQLGGRLVLPAPARRRWLAAAARAIHQPDEIRWVWVKAADGAAMPMRRYISAECVVDVGRSGWRFVPASEIEDLRLLRRGTIAWPPE